MADKTYTSVIEPNVRFAATFLNTDFSDRAIPDEVLMDKSTGELVYKRVSDGKFLYYDRENFDTDIFYMQLQNIFDHSSFWIPTPDDPTYLKTYLMMVQYNLNQFKFDTMLPTIYEDGGINVNVNKDGFSISHDSVGFFAKIKSRPRDEAVINYITAKYDNYYENYNGSDPDAIIERNLFSDPTYLKSNVDIHFRLSWFKNGSKVYTQEFIGHARANQISYIPFSGYTTPSVKSVDSVILEIIDISMPKLKMGKKILTSQVESMILNKSTDTDCIKLLSCDITATVTETEKSITMPNQNYCTILLLSGIGTVTETFKTVGGNDSGGVLLSTEYPSIDTWRTTKLWMERMRDVVDGGELVELDSPTSFTDMEEFFRKPLPTSSGFTTDPNKTDGFYIETKTTKTLSLLW